mgnify:CR=1 FL=1
MPPWAVQIVVMNHADNTFIPFINQGGSKPLYQYAPQYYSSFKDCNCECWARFKDYDHDGDMDIFCSNNSNVSLYPNTPQNGVAQISLAFAELDAVYFGRNLSLFSSRVFLPDFLDIDGDGDLDFTGLAGTVVRWVASPDARHDASATSIDDGVPRWNPSDPTNRVRVWFMPEQASQPIPLVGTTLTANFDTHSGVSWSQLLKIDRYTWPQDLGSDDPIMVIIDFVDEAARDTYLIHPEHQKAGAGIVEVAVNGVGGIMVFDLSV